MSYEISIEGDPIDGYDLLIDGKLIKHFDAKEYDDYDLARDIVSELEIPIEDQLRMAKKSLDTVSLEVMSTRDIYDLADTYGIDIGDKIYNSFMKLEGEGSGVELGLRLDRNKGKVYVTMINGVMLERDAELI